MQRRPALSAVIITQDAASQITACLESLSFAEDVVVVDSGSTDETVERARAAGARVIETAWRGFGPQKQFAVEQARHDWVLCIDADEVISDALRDAIMRELEAPRCKAYALARSNYFLGRYLRHGEGYPDWTLRLFRRDVARWSEDRVHERVITETAVGRLSRHGVLLHHSAERLDTYLDKQNRYTTLQAENLYQEGRRAGLARLVISPALRFLKFYVVRGGFLDGVPGLVHISIGCFNSFMKYAKLRSLYAERA